MWVVKVGAILVVCLLSSVVCQVPQYTKDTIFKKPILENPKILELDDSDNFYWGGGRTADIIVKAKNNMTLTKPVKVQNVRHVVVVGIHFTISASTWSSDAMDHHALRFQNIYGVAWVEGCLIDNAGGKLAEGIDLWSDTTNGYGALVVVNTRVTDTTPKPGDGGCAGGFKYDHYDLIQATGGYLALQNVTLLNGCYQGIMTNGNDGKFHGIFMDNVNLGNIIAYSIMFYSLSSDTVIVQQLDNVFYNVTGSCYSNGSPATISKRLWPDKDQPNGLVATADGVRWDNTSYIAKGLQIYAGSPATGDYAPANKVGINYDPAFFSGSSKPSTSGSSTGSNPAATTGPSPSTTGPNPTTTNGPSSTAGPNPSQGPSPSSSTFLHANLCLMILAAAHFLF